jgi:hypothetical protein
MSSTTLAVVLSVMALGTRAGETALDPIVQGKLYSEWIALVIPWRLNPEAHPQVPNAIREGAEAGKGLFLAYLGTNSATYIKLPITNAVEQIKQNRDSAQIGIYILGKQADNMVPDLLDLLGNEEWDGRRSVAHSIAQIRTGWPEVTTKGLKDSVSSSVELRINAMILLSGITTSKKVLNQIIKSCGDSDKKVREFAIYALSKHQNSARARAVMGYISKGELGFGQDPTDRARARIYLGQVEPNIRSEFVQQRRSEFFILIS